MQPTTQLQPAAVARPVASPPSTASPWTAAFLGTFVAAWAVLDRLVTSPPTVVSATISLAAATTMLVSGELVLSHTPPQDLVRRLGLGRANARALGVAAIVGGAVFATYVTSAELFDIDTRASDLRAAHALAPTTYERARGAEILLFSSAS